jgi:hypothetical protein
MIAPRHLGALLLAGTALAACDDSVRPDRAGPPEGSVFNRTEAARGTTDGPRLVPNRVRYRDTGAQPARGRAGNAELQARALLSSNGIVTLDVATGDFYGWWSTGTLTNVQVSLRDEDDRAIWTRAYQSRDASMASYVLPGAGPGAAVRVQGTVKQSWPARTGVVTLTETVRRRPDLAVTGLHLPPEARLRAPTLIKAVVEERNGEMGALATCALFVDGRLQDWMDWVWVDAGDVVTCAFVVQFRTPGTRTVRVALRDTNPGDWDESNNAMEGTVEVSSEVGFEWWAFAESDVEPFRYSFRSDHRATNARGVVVYEEGYLSEAHGQAQHASVNGSLPTGVSFPLEAIYLRQETGDRVFHSQTLRDRNPTWRWEEEDYGEACFSAWGRGQVLGFAHLHLCTGYWRTWEGELDEWTWVDYGRNAGDVTYHSSGYSRYFDEVTGEEFYYSWNYDSESSEPGFFQYGEDYTLEVRVTDRGKEYPILAVVPLEITFFEWQEPYTCHEWTDDWSGLTFSSCFSGEQYIHRLDGWATNTVF